jgi:hypothetical protein
METFSLKINEFVESSLQEIEETHGSIILELFTGVILDTPVLEGRLRANWIMTESSPAGGTVDSVGTNYESESKNKEEGVRGKLTSAKFNEVSNHINKLDLRKDFKVYLTNNLPYAYRIEYYGYSGKAPEGMVRKNFERIIQNLKS